MTISEHSETVGVRAVIKVVKALSLQATVDTAVVAVIQWGVLRWPTTCGPMKRSPRKLRSRSYVDGVARVPDSTSRRRTFLRCCESIPRSEFKTPAPVKIKIAD